MQTAADWRGAHRGAPELAGDSSPTVRRTPALAIDRWALRQVHRHLNDSGIALALWDNTRMGPPASATRVSVRIADRATLYGLVRDPEVTFGDAYSDGRIEVAGDLLYLLEAAYRAPDWRLSRSNYRRRLAGRVRLPTTAS